MALTSSVVSVGTTATLLATASGRTEVILRQVNGNTVYLGSSGITVSGGLSITSNDGSPLYLTMSHGDSIYGIVNAGTSDVGVITQN